MKLSLLFIILVFVLCSCSLQKGNLVQHRIEISDKALTQASERSIKELMTADWGSTFQANHNVRPVVMTGKIAAHDNIDANTSICYDLIDMYMVRSGNVRVVKTNEDQRSMDPHKLVTGVSVDFVVSVKIRSTSPDSAIMEMNLWGDGAKPIKVVSKLIQ